MSTLREIYRPPLGLLTDLYQLTMACGYWKLGRADREAVFHLFFRSLPFDGGYAIAAGLRPALEFVEGFRIDRGDVSYLSTLTGNDGQPLFEPAFLEYLSDLRMTVSIDAVDEGTAVFRSEPLLRVRGPILQCQLLETALLNIINFQTLIATKAARICTAARGEPVVEFGLRRAQGIDGSLSASRAAYIGGCAATSNILAGKLYGIPVRGTHAHSWVMSFDNELEAFQRYADVQPNNCIFLVDTYDTLEGVRRAIQVGQRLRVQGHEMVGIRLDSGDLAHLSIEARKLLDDAGFSSASIVATNDLDERIIESLKLQDAKVNVWGVGTRLVTAYDQPALGGVYKLGAIRDDDGNWQPKIKVSEQLAKSTIPGMLQVRRFETAQEYIGDMLFDELDGAEPGRTIVDPFDATRRKTMPGESAVCDLLHNVMADGKIVAPIEELSLIRDRTAKQLAKLPPGTRRFLNSHEYPVGLGERLHELRDRMIRELRGLPAAAGFQAEQR